MNGLSFVASNRILTEKDIEPVSVVHANWVALMPFGFMNSATDPSLTFDTNWQWWGETTVGIQTTATLFEKKNIKRMLKPQIWIKGGKFTGFIAMANDDDWKLLEQNYEDFILHYAKLAQEENIELFCLGTELKLFVKNRPEFWISLISKIRTIYTGQLTYAANWDSYKQVSFWQHLDCIGIDAYFPLSMSETPSVQALIESWKTTKTALSTFSQNHQKSIIFTEYGYRSIDFCAQEPWDSEIQGNYNDTAQNNALTAMYATFWNEPWFAGGFLWKWFDNHADAGGIHHTGFTVQNKKSEHLVKQFYNYQTLTNE